MKKTYKTTAILFSILFLFASIFVSAQTVTLHTPNGSTVEAFMNVEMASQDITYYTNLYRNSYPQAEVLANASSTYNCHSYAWNLSEGGAAICWLNQSPDLHKYWDDYSYFETTESNTKKIFYYNGDHSAIKSKTVVGKYESKWGAMPLMRHAPEYGPSIYNMTYRKYYIKLSDLCSISGLSQIICGQGTYSIQNLPAGYTVSWTSSPSGIISHPVTGSQITVTKIGNGNVTLTATINSALVLTKNMWIGPHTTINGIETMLKGRTRTYTLNDVSGQGITSFSWSADGGVIPVGSTTSSSFKVKGAGCGSGTVSCTYGNSCGTGNAQLDIEVICETLSMLLSPNPTSDVININLVTAFDKTAVIDDNNLLAENYTTKQVNNQYAGEFEIQVWNEYSGLISKIKDKNKPNLQISLKNKPRGMYYFHLIVDGVVVQKKTIILKD